MIRHLLHLLKLDLFVAVGYGF